MEKFLVEGGHRLSGEVTISGAKNAAVAILPATILCEDVCVIENIPNISDVTIILQMLQDMGASVRLVNKTTVEIDTRGVFTNMVPAEQARHFRASYYFLGVLLGRFREARSPLPGGCDFGDRPIDQHLKGFSALGAEHEIEHGGIIRVAADRLIGNQIYFDVVSVGATMNVMLAAVKAEGMTILENCAREPHIVDLANFLNSMGADIRGAGTDVIKIRGVKELHGANYSIIPDQIEAGTYMVMAAATGGDILVKNIIPKHLESISQKLELVGCNITEYDEAVRVVSSGIIRKANIKTMPHPGFPTDMQPQITALLCMADGTSIVTESVWDHRFKYVDELRRMGADIVVDGKVAVIEGVESLKGAPVKATDLRAGAAMVIAGLMAEGVTEIEDVRHIERGYENILFKMSMLGARIKKMEMLPQQVVTAL